ncbi:MAG: hypothetical protein ACKPJD_29390, partial [Planctomycetaceae bacterium]
MNLQMMRKLSSKLNPGAIKDDSQPGQEEILKYWLFNRKTSIRELRDAHSTVSPLTPPCSKSDRRWRQQIFPLQHERLAEQQHGV